MIMLWVGGGQLMVLAHQLGNKPLSRRLITWPRKKTQEKINTDRLANKTTTNKKQQANQQNITNKHLNYIISKEWIVDDDLIYIFDIKRAPEKLKQIKIIKQTNIVDDVSSAVASERGK